MNKNFKAGAQGGFTLIELIVVIVILGILAATALPKFSNLSGDARLASLQAAKGSLASVTAMTHGKYLINTTTYGSTVAMENVNVAMANGYPTATFALAQAAGLSEDDFVITPSSTASTTTAATTLTVTPKNTSDTKCVVTYTPASSLTSPPTIVLTSGATCN